MNTLERLVNFNNGHKARSVNVFHEDGYGASSWNVELFWEKGDIQTVKAAEFCTYDTDFDLAPIVVKNDKYFATYDDKYLRVYLTSGHDWAGLENTINAAIDFAEMKMNKL